EAGPAVQVGGPRQVPRLGVRGAVRLPRPPRLAQEVGLAHGSSFFTWIVPRSRVSPGFRAARSFTTAPPLIPTRTKFRAPGRRQVHSNSPRAFVRTRPEPPSSVRAKFAYHRMREEPYNSSAFTSPFSPVISRLATTSPPSTGVPSARTTLALTFAA